MKENFFNKKGVYASIVVTILSVCFLITALVGIEFDVRGLESVCLLGLLIEILYGGIFILKILNNKNEYDHIIPFLFLNWFVGCFSTNILICVFENLPVWVYVVTFIFCLSNFFIYNNYKHKIITPLAYFSNGISFLMIIYFMFYLIPIMPISFVGILAVGLGFYGLVPAIVSFWHIMKLFYNASIEKKNLLQFFSGITLGIAGIVVFVIVLHGENQKINSFLITKTFDTNSDLPGYIRVSQNLEPNFCNEILLKKGIVYIHSEDFFEFRGLDGLGTKQYNERKTHNPIVNIAYMFMHNLSLTADDRINILKSNFDKRLETEEQLWSGMDLVTKNIKEDVKIYSNERLAYTEITMDVACDEGSGRVDKEAIYSFQLPEGSVATSLSLWVNGVERKGVLTTKEKAKAAYNQIVGVESRDPSLMQWKEGNRVVVRVFPINEALPRTFKCGFTTPLKVSGNEMVYSSLNIKGPNISNAETLSRIQMVGNGKFESSKEFELKNGFYINESEGLDKWEAVMPLNNNAFGSSFVWENKAYEIKKTDKEKISFKPSEVVLDLNASWEEEELEAILENSNSTYYVFINNEKLEINKENYESFFDQFKSLQYSLIPFYKLKENALVVTKSGSISANFEELEASPYLKKVKENAKSKNIKVIAISSDINPFWQTVKEQKYVDFLQTNLKECVELIAKNHFIIIRRNENRVNLEVADVAIEESPANTNSKNNGSNHIFRMYAFARILDEQIKIQEDTLSTNKFVDLAKEANVVSPVSSLIVLETDEDYENNGIEKNVNTLGNASVNNDGAVPEPHEWAMIIILVLTLLFYYKRQMNKSAY
ncbi:XrtN system VIT domain-containing protein [Flavobacterium amniphilum]|uniref:XrtN system VIT domain-containing protein n=1 Tax=Flavobacterium amniphilum TaxID=1834035 RepID=UPI00202AB8F2|nr:XrtN system VIT domain-containing protein [Flavobacterium amniphilum]MCL9804630.1 XrtN system VIT domain-containing protein [Flavobacterium amniphilum]